MKLNFKIGAINIQGVMIRDLEISQEYTTKEFVDLVYAGKNFMKDIIKEAPEIMEDLEVAQNKFEEINNRILDKQQTESVIQTAKKAIYESDKMQEIFKMLMAE